MTRLEFFSGIEALGNDTGAHGYDGSMSVEAFDAAADTVRLLQAMDCVYGPCLIVETTAEGYKRSWPCDRSHTAEEAAEEVAKAEREAARLVNTGPMDFATATGQERSYECQDGAEFIRDHDGFAIGMSGHYTAGELRAKLAQLEEANRFYGPAA